MLQKSTINFLQTKKENLSKTQKFKKNQMEVLDMKTMIKNFLSYQMDSIVKWI